MRSTFYTHFTDKRDVLDGSIVGGPAPGQTKPVKAVTAFETLTCEAFDLAALRQFSTAWFNDPRSQ